MGGLSHLGHLRPLAGVTRPAKRLQVLEDALASTRHRDDVIDGEIVPVTTPSAAVAITLEDLATELRGDVSPRIDARLRHRTDEPGGFESLVQYVVHPSSLTVPDPEERRRALLRDDREERAHELGRGDLGGVGRCHLDSVLDFELFSVVHGAERSDALRHEVAA